MAITINGSGITSANIADGTITASDISASEVKNLKSGRKNLIINGGMKISQRGDYTSATSITNGNYYLDRLAPYRNGASATVQQTDVTINGVNKKAIKVVATTTSTGYIGFYQTIELQNIPVGETLIVSCWVRSNNSNTRFRTNDFRGVDTDGTAFTNDGNWEKVSWTFDSSSTTSNPTIWLITYNGGSVSVTSGDYLEVADLQLEVGSTATDFEHRSYGEELALCQRYCLVKGGEVAYELFLWGTGNGSVTATGVLFPPVPFRVRPTLTLSGRLDINIYNFTSSTSLGNPTNNGAVITSIASTNTIYIDFAITGGTSGNTYMIRADNDLSARFILDAEL